MASRYQGEAAAQTPELILSDSEDAYDSSDDEQAEAEQVNNLLKRAHHYVITEGGKDSPSTYLDRIQKIDRSLLKMIAECDYACDRKLYRAVKQKIDHVQREIEDDVGADPSVYDDDDYLPECHTMAKEEALYRKKDGPITPEASITRNKTRTPIKTDSERTYMYGGPDNYPEHWHKEAPAALPFPETIRMADWESLRIHWDLKNTGDMKNKEPVTSNGVSFNNPLLAHHNTLAQCESGSGFKLPTIQLSDMELINKLVTPDSLHRAVNAFYRSDDTKRENGDYMYAPRAFLETLHVGHQTTPESFVDDVRSAVNTTPTRPRGASSGSSRIGSIIPATRGLYMKQQQASEVVPVSQTVELNNYSSASVVHTSIQVSQNRSRTTTPEPSSRNTRASSPAVRRIKAAIEDAVSSSPQPQSPPGYIEAASTKVATHVLIAAKSLRSHSQKNQPSVTTVPAYQYTQAGTKRKRLNTDDTYKSPTVDADIEQVAEEAKQLRVKRRRTTQTPTYGRYNSVRELRRSESQPSTPTSTKELEVPALTPASADSSAASTPPGVKARATKKKRRRIQRKYPREARVSPEVFEKLMAKRRKGMTADGHESVARGSTRSGKIRKA